MSFIQFQRAPSRRRRRRLIATRCCLFASRATLAAQPCPASRAGARRPRPGLPHAAFSFRLPDRSCFGLCMRFPLGQPGFQLRARFGIPMWPVFRPGAFPVGVLRGLCVPPSVLASRQYAPRACLVPLAANSALSLASPSGPASAAVPPTSLQGLGHLHFAMLHAMIRICRARDSSTRLAASASRRETTSAGIGPVLCRWRQIARDLPKCVLTACRFRPRDGLIWPLMPSCSSSNPF